jgi:hypothetical protein
VWWDGGPDGRVKAPALRACPEHTTAPVGGAAPIDNAAAQLDRILHAVADVRDLLWPADEPDRSWSPDTIDEIADRLAFLRSETGRR